MMQLFYQTPLSRCEKAIRIVLAAVAYVNMESPSLPKPPQLTTASFPNEAIEKGLKGAHHFRHLQNQSEDDITRACVQIMLHLQKAVYAIFEAIIAIRTNYRHHQHLNQFPAHKHQDILANFEALTAEIGAGSLPARILGPSIAFLCCGVKGLLLWPKDTSSRWGQVKLGHFVMLTDQLHQNQPINEPIWKHTQTYILDLIEAALFPNGFEKSRADFGNIASDDQWHHKECSKLLLAKAIQMDLANFCANRSQFSGGEPYPDPAFHLPICPTATGPKKNKKVDRK